MIKTWKLNMEPWQTRTKGQYKKNIWNYEAVKLITIFMVEYLSTQRWCVRIWEVLGWKNTKWWQSFEEKQNSADCHFKLPGYCLVCSKCLAWAVFPSVARNPAWCHFEVIWHAQKNWNFSHAFIVNSYLTTFLSSLLFCKSELFSILLTISPKSNPPRHHIHFQKNFFSVAKSTSSNFILKQILP